MLSFQNTWVPVLVLQNTVCLLLRYWFGCSKIGQNNSGFDKTIGSFFSFRKLWAIGSSNSGKLVPQGHLGIHTPIQLSSPAIILVCMVEMLVYHHPTFQAVAKRRIWKASVTSSYSPLARMSHMAIILSQVMLGNVASSWEAMCPYQTPVFCH